MLLAKPIVKNKCWVVEEDGTKVGTILATEQGVTLVQGQKRERFASLKNLTMQYNIHVDKAKPQKVSDNSHGVYGYPCEYKMHNILWDVQKRVPVFTKSAKSKSFFCAGYYLIKFNVKWTKAYCPKLITLNRYLYKGPFASIEEVQTHLKYANGGRNV